MSSLSVSRSLTVAIYLSIFQEEETVVCLQKNTNTVVDLSRFPINGKSDNLAERQKLRLFLLSNSRNNQQQQRQVDLLWSSWLFKLARKRERIWSLPTRKQWVCPLDSRTNHSSKIYCVNFSRQYSVRAEGSIRLSTSEVKKRVCCPSNSSNGEGLHLAGVVVVCFLLTKGERVLATPASIGSGCYKGKGF